ncbi:MAG: class II fructose-bisphosphate aldolase [Bacteroidales bacterium]
MLVSYADIIKKAHEGKYAVGAFNSLSVENILGAIAAAEELNAPIILQLAEVQFPTAPLHIMAPLFIAAAKSAKVPVAVHLDHGNSFETCEAAARLGFTGVMFDGACLPMEENIRISKRVAEMAKAYGIGCEAELGRVGDTGEGGGEGTGDASTADVFTDVEESAYFVEQTGIDALAIAIGNLHGNYVATPKLNITRMIEISERNNLPLVLHGGTGTSDEDFKSCVRNGICKVNVATAIQMKAMSAVQKYLQNPKRSYEGMKTAVINATKEVVTHHILLFESNGKAL